MRRLCARIHGRVQGVSFRWYTQKEATRLGVSGWVRNCDDGSVELVAEGDEDALRELVAWCRQGPPAARVTAVDVSWSEATGEGGGSFRIRH